MGLPILVIASKTCKNLESETEYIFSTLSNDKIVTVVSFSTKLIYKFAVISIDVVMRMQCKDLYP